MENLKQNPFLNHLIIEKIVSYTNRLPELKALRLISRQWNESVSHKLLQTSIVNLKCQREMDLYLKHFGGSPPHLNYHWKAAGLELSGDNLLSKVIQVAEEFHVSKALITSVDLVSILKMGNSLKTLSFNEVFIQKEEAGEVQEVVNNLQRLEICWCDKDEHFPWKEILPKLPQLKILHAQLQTSSQVTTLLESMLQYPVRLEELSCFLVDMTEEHLHLLECLELPLKIIDISLSSNVTNRSVEGFLGSKTCANLEVCKIFKESDCGHKNYFSLPQMKKLKSLEILGDPVAKCLKSVKESCPVLESLNLSELSCRDVMSQSFLHLKLQSLCIEECFFPPNVLQKLAETFVCLEKLMLFLNDDNVGIVYEKFENLTELTILGTEISDEGITGGRHHHEVVTERPYIGDCKKLRALNLYPQPLPGITDASIHHGLAFVQELTSLSLPETAITDKGLRSLLRLNSNVVKLHAKVSIDGSTHEHFLRSVKYQIL